jgi:hypothetical protein
MTTRPELPGLEQAYTGLIESAESMAQTYRFFARLCRVLCLKRRAERYQSEAEAWEGEAAKYAKELAGCLKRIKP